MIPALASKGICALTYHCAALETVALFAVDRRGAYTLLDKGRSARVMDAMLER